jgi:hypothetical protein
MNKVIVNLSALNNDLVLVDNYRKKNKREWAVVVDVETKYSVVDGSVSYHNSYRVALLRYSQTSKFYNQLLFLTVGDEAIVNVKASKNAQEYMEESNFDSAQIDIYKQITS